MKFNKGDKVFYTGNVYAQDKPQFGITTYVRKDSGGHTLIGYYISIDHKSYPSDFICHATPLHLSLLGEK